MFSRFFIERPVFVFTAAVYSGIIWKTVHLFGFVAVTVASIGKNPINVVQ